MPLGYEYKRYFIILQEEEKGYEIAGGKIPTGYAKIEIKKDKAKVTGFIQNIKWDEKSEYKMVLLAPKFKTAIDLGRFRMDNSGRGEFYCELDSDNVLGRGIEITEYEAALVASGPRVPLFGYIGRERVDWKEWYNKKGEIKKEEVKKEVIKEEPEVEMLPPDVIKEKAKEEPKKEMLPPEVKKEIIKEEPKKEMLPPEVKKEIIEEEPKKEICPPDVIEETVEEEPKEEMCPPDVMEEIIEEEPEVEMPSHDEMKEVPYCHYFHDVNMGGISEEVCEKKDVYKRLVKALRNLDEFKGFQESGKQRWYVIGNGLHLLNSVIINLNGARMPLSYPYIAEGYGPWIKHCIIGIEYDDEEINKVFIGVPGAYNSICKQCFNYKGFTGYKKTKKGKMGYWIMCIDLKKETLCRK